MSQPLLLLHGALGSASLMKPLARELDSRFAVHTLDFSGHGGRPLEEEFSISLFARDVLAYMDANGLEKAAVFGFSMGGYVALHLAVQHPERISKVCTLGTKFSWSPEIAAQEVRFLDAEKIKEKVPPFARALAQQHGPQNWEQLVEHTRRLLLGLGQAPPLTVKKLAEVQVPVVIGRGAQDEMVGPEESRLAAESIPGGRLKELPDTPHPIEKADPRVLAAFLQKELA